MVSAGYCIVLMFLLTEPMMNQIRDAPWPSEYCAWLPSVKSRIRVSTGSPVVGLPGRYINVWRCGGLSMVLLQLEVPLKLFKREERKKFLPCSGFISRHYISSSYSMYLP